MPKKDSGDDRKSTGWALKKKLIRKVKDIALDREVPYYVLAETALWQWLKQQPEATKRDVALADRELEELASEEKPKQTRKKKTKPVEETPEQ